MSDENNPENDLSNLHPWNSKDYPVKVNSIRYNQDFSLLTLGTSKGYKIFLTSNMRQVNEETEEVKNLGDISIAMAYFKSSLVFCLPSRHNQKHTNKEVIIFDDFYQAEFASLKDKSEEISNLFVSKNVLFLITLSKIIVVELNTFQVVDIILNINSTHKLVSFNFVDFIAYTLLKDKKKVFINYYQNKQHKIFSLMKKEITSSFEYVQTLQISPCGDVVGIVSIFGNKIHIYCTQDGKLKDCLFLGPTVQTIENILFSELKPNYLFVLKNDNKFYIYKLSKVKVDKPKCICSKYDDRYISSSSNTETKNSGIFSFFRRPSRNKDIKDVHAFAEFEEEFKFLDFDRNKRKDIILIDNRGQLIKYHFNKNPSGNITPILKVQWE